MTITNVFLRGVVEWSRYIHNVLDTAIEIGVIAAHSKCSIKLVFVVSWAACRVGSKLIQLGGGP